MRHVILLSAGLSLMLSGTAAHAVVDIDIDLTHQRMHVEGDDGPFDWPISSARSGFYTPGGSFAPTHLERMHYSKKYHMSPMPYAIFFRGGYAIHGTYSTASLGRPASHGCVRLSPGNAKTLYDMVQRDGGLISIHGTPPASRPFFEARRHAPRFYQAAQNPYGDGVSATPSYFGFGYPASGGGYSYAPAYGYAPQTYYGQ